MKYIKTRQNFVIERRTITRTEIKDNYKGSVLVNEILSTGNLTWGGSLLGRLISSIFRKLKIEWGKMRLKDLVVQLRRELFNLVAESKLKNDDEFREPLAKSQLAYIIQAIEEACTDPNQTEADKIETLVGEGNDGEGLISEVIQSIEDDIDESILPRKEEFLDKLREFREKIIALIEKDEETQLSVDFSAQSARFFKGVYDLMKNYNQVELENAGTTMATGAAKHDFKKGDVCFVKDKNHEKFSGKGTITEISQNIGTPDTIQLDFTPKKVRLSGGTPGAVVEFKPNQLLKVQSPEGNKFSKWIKNNPSIGLTASERIEEFEKILTEDFNYNFPLFDFGNYLIIQEQNSGATASNPTTLLLKKGDAPRTHLLLRRIRSAIRDTKNPSEIVAKNEPKNDTKIIRSALMELLTGYAKFSSALAGGNYRSVKKELKYRKSIKILGAEITSFYKKQLDKGGLMSKDDLLKESKETLKYGEVDQKFAQVLPLIKRLINTIMNIDFVTMKEEGIYQGKTIAQVLGTQTSYRIDIIKNVTLIQKSLKKMLGIFNSFKDKDERSEMINEGKKVRKINEAKNQDRVLQIWEDSLGKEKDEWVISQEEFDEYSKKTEDKLLKKQVVELDSDRVVKVMRIFGWAYDIYCSEYIPSNRPGGVVSPKTLREYRQLGGEGSREAVRSTSGDGPTAMEPGRGPWINIAAFKVWDEGVNDLLENPDVIKLLARCIVATNESVSDDEDTRGYRGRSDDEDSQSKYARSTLLQFVTKLMDISGDADFYKERRKLYVKYVLGEVPSEIGNTPAPREPHPENGGEPANKDDIGKASWYQFGQLGLKIGSSWKNNDSKDWVGKFFRWGIAKTESKKTVSKFWTGYIIGIKDKKVYLIFDEYDKKNCDNLILSNIDVTIYKIDGLTKVQPIRYFGVFDENNLYRENKEIEITMCKSDKNYKPNPPKITVKFKITNVMALGTAEANADPDKQPDLKPIGKGQSSNIPNAQTLANLFTRR